MYFITNAGCSSYVSYLSDPQNPALETAIVTPNVRFRLLWRWWRLSATGPVCGICIICRMEALTDNVEPKRDGINMNLRADGRTIHANTR